MSTTIFEPEVVINGVTVFQGKINRVEVKQDPDPLRPGHVSNMVIDPSRPFTIEIEWQIDGNLGYVNMILNALSTPSWNIQIFAEKMGPGDDVALYNGDWANSISPVQALPQVWITSVPIPANTLVENWPSDPSKSGMYKLCVIIFANTNLPGGDDIIGCYEGPMILVENPE